jgi:hypothetical protein
MGTWTITACNTITYTIGRSNAPAAVAIAVAAGVSQSAPVMTVLSTDVSLDGQAYTVEYVGTDGS